MFGFLDRWLKRSPQPQNGSALELESEVQRLKLELKDRDSTISSLKNDLARATAGETARLQQIEARRTESLITAASTPAVQLATQAYLLETGKPVQAKDVLAVAQNLVRELETTGMRLTPIPGEVVSYDAAVHEPMQGSTIAPGTKARVKMAGVRHGDKIVRKAVVAPE